MMSIRCSQLVLLNVVQHIFNGHPQSRVFVVSKFNLICQFAINKYACLFALFLISSKFLRCLYLNMHLLRFYQIHLRVLNLDGTCRFFVLHVEWPEISMRIWT